MAAVLHSFASFGFAITGIFLSWDYPNRKFYGPGSADNSDAGARVANHGSNPRELLDGLCRGYWHTAIVAFCICSNLAQLRFDNNAGARGNLLEPVCDQGLASPTSVETGRDYRVRFVDR